MRFQFIYATIGLTNAAVLTSSECPVIHAMIHAMILAACITLQWIDLRRMFKAKI